MKIVVVGMGIIGGSYAKSLKKYTDNFVVGINRSPAPLAKALNAKAIDKIGTIDDLKDADIIILGVYPAAAVEFIKANAKYIKPDCIVTDTSGTKREICPQLNKLAREHNFIFIGSHPMAGKEKNGFDASDADLFKGASFIIVPEDAPKKAVDALSKLALKIGFGNIRMSTAQEHDEMIAFTSQLPHALACAYVLSPRCPHHQGFSAGSYRDVSRVANINAQLWSELFLENREPLINELDTLINNLNKIKSFIEDKKQTELEEILKQGKSVKEALGE